VLILIATPLLLILFSTFTKLGVDRDFFPDSILADTIIFLGHPFSALIIATLLSIWLLCVRRGMSKQKILEFSNRSLGPAGLIILITGAGGVLKQILVDSGVGKAIAESIDGSPLPPVFFAWSLAAVVRVTQGSATVAMITAAGILAPAIEMFNLGDSQTAIMVIAIASGATLLSHFNDSGFWLVSKYFGMDEKQTLRSWTVMETIIALCGLLFCLIASSIVA
jgi:Gnt-I system low-affinity gluconate transporter